MFRSILLVAAGIVLAVTPAEAVTFGEPGTEVQRDFMHFESPHAVPAALAVDAEPDVQLAGLLADGNRSSDLLGDFYPLGHGHRPIQLLQMSPGEAGGLPVPRPAAVALVGLGVATLLFGRLKRHD